MKIVLAALNAKYVHSNLAVYDLEGYARARWGQEYGDDPAFLLAVREYTINHNLDQIMQSLFLEQADVVAFSCYIWNISEILTISRELKKVVPDLSIWLGGPEVSYDSARVLENNPWIDGIIRGEGEATFYEVVKYYIFKREREKNGYHPLEENGENADQMITDAGEIIGQGLESISGIVYRKKNGTIIHNPVRSLIPMDDIPFVHADLAKYENKIIYYESSRGCPFSCSYCLSSIDKRVRFRSLPLVKKELAYFIENRVPQVKFIDRTFNCDKARAREIWQFLLERDNGVTNFHFEIAADLIEQEELRIFAQMRPGLIQLEIGLQSTNQAVIREIRRVMDVEKLRRNMLSIRRMGNIHQHLDLIAGLPLEDYESFKRSFNDAYGMKPNQLQLGFLKVLKGSYMEEQAEAYGLVYRDEQPYEVLATKWISYGELLKLKQVEEMVEVYYNSDQFEHVLPYLETFFDTPFAMYDRLGAYYEKHALSGVGYKREARYVILRDFFLECVSFEGAGMVRDGLESGEYALEGMALKHTSLENAAMNRKQLKEGVSVFDSLLTFDYYLRENVKNRPSWSREDPIEKSVYQNFFKKGGTEEIILVREGYDSKIAARSMHIEPVAAEAVSWITQGTGQEPEQYKDENGACAGQTVCYAVFDYDNRNPLTGDAAYTIITHL